MTRGRKRKLVLLTGAGVIVLLVAASLAILGPTGVVREDFDEHRLSGWALGDHPLGRGTVRPANVDHRHGQVLLRLPRGTRDGGEIRSRRQFGDGAFVARLKLPRAPGSLTGFFLYQPPDLHSEIDVELVNSPDGRILFTTYNQGRERHEEGRLGFDPTRGFHEYGFERGSDGVRFTVDGEVRSHFDSNAPRAAMNLYLNAWWPKWLKGGPPSRDAQVTVDWIEYQE